MARFLALDWDQREVRVAVATATAGQVRVRALRAVPLVMQPVEEGETPQPNFGQTLRQALGDESPARATVLVSVDRAHVEFLEMTLPPAKDAELSELVSLQAMRDSPAVTEDAAIDYLPLTTDVTQPRKVLAAAVPAEQMARFHGICATAGLKPRRLLLRTYALASLFTRTAHAPERGLLLVDRIDDEADLVVLLDGRPAFQRTVRLPSGEHADKAVQRLLTEIQRTLSVAPSDPDQPAIECIYLCGRPADQEALATKITQTIGLETRVFDPFHALNVPEALLGDRPERFAPLLGMLLDEARGTPHAFDFINPRRAARRPNQRRPLILGALAVCVAVFIGGYNIWEKLAEADAENQQLDNQLRELKANAKKAGERTKLVAAVSDWLAGDVDWLDELRDLSLRFPPARDMIVLRMNLTSTPRAGGGEVTLQGVVRDPLVVARMENNIRDKYHEVSSKRVQERVKNKTYSWHFETSITVNRRDKEHYTSHLPRPAVDKDKDEKDKEKAAGAAPATEAAKPHEAGKATETPKAATEPASKPAEPPKTATESAKTAEPAKTTEPAKAAEAPKAPAPAAGKSTEGGPAKP